MFISEISDDVFLLSSVTQSSGSKLHVSAMAGFRKEGWFRCFFLFRAGVDSPGTLPYSCLTIAVSGVLSQKLDDTSDDGGVAGKDKVN